MQTKLTLRLDDELIEAAKAEAARRGTSLSRLVAELFRSLRVSGEPNPSAEGEPRVDQAFGPRTARLFGSLKGVEVEPEAYRRHLEAKHLSS